MSICTGIIITIALQEIDNSPNTYTCSDYGYYRL